jgi:hypothetical protein
MADDVDLPSRKREIDLLAEGLRPHLDPGDRRYTRDDDLVSRGVDRLGNPTKVRFQRQSADTNAAKSEETVSEHDRRIESGANQGCTSRFEVVLRAFSWFLKLADRTSIEHADSFKNDSFLEEF